MAILYTILFLVVVFFGVTGVFMVVTGIVEKVRWCWLLGIAVGMVAVYVLVCFSVLLGAEYGFEEISNYFNT